MIDDFGDQGSSDTHRDVPERWLSPSSCWLQWRTGNHKLVPHVLSSKCADPGRLGFVFMRRSQRIDIRGTANHAEAMVAYSGAAAYRHLPCHRTVRHSVGEYVDGMVHTNGVESFWSMLEHARKGTFHKLSAKHLHRYVNEFCGRHNIRDLDTAKQMAYTAAAMSGRRLTYTELMAGPDMALEPW